MIKFSANGWKCPECGYVFSPYTVQCYYCNIVDKTEENKNKECIECKFKDEKIEELHNLLEVKNGLLR